MMIVYKIVLFLVPFCSSHLLNNPRHLTKTIPEPEPALDLTNKHSLLESQDIHAGANIKPHHTTKTGRSIEFKDVISALIVFFVILCCILKVAYTRNYNYLLSMLPEAEKKIYLALKSFEKAQYERDREFVKLKDRLNIQDFSNIEAKRAVYLNTNE